MGFFYLKSINFGPFRVNLSKSGVGIHRVRLTRIFPARGNP